MKIRLAVRVYVDGELESEESISATRAELSEVMPSLATRHAELSMKGPTMVELEFVDEYPSADRFFRIGTDPSRMIRPVEIDCKRPN